MTAKQRVYNYIADAYDLVKNLYSSKRAVPPKTIVEIALLLQHEDEREKEVVPVYTCNPEAKIHVFDMKPSDRAYYKCVCGAKHVSDI